MSAQIMAVAILRASNGGSLRNGSVALAMLSLLVESVDVSAVGLATLLERDKALPHVVQT